MPKKTDSSYPNKLAKDLDMLMNLDIGEPAVEREPKEIRDDLIVVTASCRIPDVELYETSVCTPDVPNDVIGEVVGGLLEQMRLEGVDLLQHEIAITFGRAKDL